MGFRKPGEGASGTCSPCTAALELSLRNLPPRQPSNPSRQLAGQPATLGILDRPQTVLGSRQACLFSSPAFQACLFCSYGLPKATLSILASAALKPFSAAGRPASNVRHFGPPPNRSRQLAGLPLLFACSRPASSVLMGFRKQRSAFWSAFKPFPAPLAYSCIAAWGGSLWNVQPVHCSLRTEPPEPATSAALKPFSAAGRPASNVRHFGPPPNRSRQPAGLPLLFACSRPASSVLMGFRKPGEGASGICSPCTAALELSLRNLPPRQPSNPSRQLAGQPATLGILDGPQTVLGSWQACLFSSPVPGLPLLFLWASKSLGREPLERAARAPEA